MKNYFQKIDSNSCVCLLCENTFNNKLSLKYSHLIEEHSEHKDVEQCLKYLRKQLNKKRKTSAEKPKHSSIWKYFSKDPKNLYAKCQLCPFKVFEIREGVVEDLANHVYTKHPEDLPKKENQ